MVTGQVHKADNGSLDLCHTTCDLLDAGSLSTWLKEIKAWLDINKNDVVTVLLVNSDNVDASALKAEFVTADIESYAYTPPSTTAPPDNWPTLQTLISNNTRLMTFVATLDASDNTVAPYLMDEFTYMWENPFTVTSISKFSCLPDRPASVSGSISSAFAPGRMALMNHFLDTDEGFGITVPAVDNATVTNADSRASGSLGATVNTCVTAWSGVKPTFILVDFFNVGPAIATVDRLNGVTAPQNRLNVSQEASSASSGAGSVSRPKLSNWALVATIVGGVLLGL
jgi:hypothetical protein